MEKLFDDRKQAGWIVIPRWEDFQHYKDRNPIWIKIYTRLMDDDRFLELSFSERGLLITLWMEYAKSRSELRLDAGKLSRRIGQRVLQSQLTALLDAGFIEVADSKPHQKFPLEVEKEIEKETPKPPLHLRNGKKGESFVCLRCGVVHGSQQRLDEHVELIHA